jgi:hypothetical protein
MSKRKGYRRRIGNHKGQGDASVQLRLNARWLAKKERQLAEHELVLKVARIAMRHGLEERARLVSVIAEAKRDMPELRQRARNQRRRAARAAARRAS